MYSWTMLKVVHCSLNSEDACGRNRTEDISCKDKLYLIGLYY